MKNTRTMETSEGLARRLCDRLCEAGAEDVVLIDLRDLIDFADYFVVCHALSRPHMKALSDLIEELLARCNAPLRHVEGLAGLRWAIFDIQDIVLHLFSEDARSYYGLESLWREAPQERILRTTLTDSKPSDTV